LGETLWSGEGLAALSAEEWRLIGEVNTQQEAYENDQRDRWQRMRDHVLTKDPKDATADELLAVFSWGGRAVNKLRAREPVDPSRDRR
jgi:hypothetical protein